MPGSSPGMTNFRVMLKAVAFNCTLKPAAKHARKVMSES
jgi:hypothetical protein